MAGFTHAIEITERMSEVAESFGNQYGVSIALHEDDQLLGYFIKRMKMMPESAIDAYFRGGHSDALRVAELVKEHGGLGDGKKILEFAAGFGRVTRHLKNFLPDNHFVASDVHGAACTFIREQIGVPVEASTTVPEALRLATTFDLIFVLSLFSHLPHSTFGRWLTRLYDALAPGGILMFTTHGDFAMRKHPDFFGQNFDVSMGFGYRSDSDQEDLDGANYGTAVVSFEYVARELSKRIPEAAIISFHSGMWFGLEDQWTIKKPPLS